MRKHRLSWMSAVALASGVVQLAFVSVARAEEDSATETAAARTLAVDGLKLAQSGKCDEAIPKLDRAEKLHHSVIVLSRLGECKVSEGKLVEGTEMLRKVLREPLPANPTPALSKAYERAQTVLDSAKPRIAALTISIGGAQVPDLRLTVDGQTVAGTLVDSELPADPGEHLVEASAPGYLKAVARITLSAADHKTVTLKVDKDPNAPVVVPHPAGAAADAPAAQPASGGAPLAATSNSPPPPVHEAPSHAGAYVAWGIGVVGVGVGTAFGLVAMSDKHNLNGQCNANVCPSTSRDSLDSAKRAGNISTIAFGVGGAGLVLGTVLYFAIGNGSAEAGSTTPPRHFAGLSHGRALVGPGSVQLAADF